MAGIRKLTESVLNKATAIDYDANNNPLYIGKAEKGSAKSAAVWQLKKFIWDANNNLTDIRWPDGSDSYEYIWDNRNSYSFS
ncbi:MAG TPA: hypothetical protein VI387_00795 [Candidatus Brocadiales bacterium]|nr:hypothetical protein [Candidatus Brocadiales bacterium]